MCHGNNSNRKPQKHRRVDPHFNLYQVLFPLSEFLGAPGFVEYQQRKTLCGRARQTGPNFQLSILLYSLAIGILCFPFFVLLAADFALIDAIDRHSNYYTMNDIQNLIRLLILFFVAQVFLLGLFVFELYAVISATVLRTEDCYTAIH
ncbi:MAG: hypothetical protein R2773_03020 [Flavobacteriaceae bacterium]